MSPKSDPMPSTDLSEQAINERIAEVVALNRLCDSLGRSLRPSREGSSTDAAPEPGDLRQELRASGRRR